ncbi:hypothetical protein [Chitinophaga sp. MM2321]|uniref:hypothetical protein n=1 Tax=Chitinophaga sp. MM2321 TaxID=3137178 RepID=UPI0032D5AF45
MRKLTVVLAAFVMIAASCKKDSNNPDAEPPGKPGVEAPPEAERDALPGKVVMTNETGQSTTFSITYLPDSKKIDRITTQNGAEIYHYTGDLIEKIDYNTDGSNYTKFEYQNNDLIRETHYRSSQPAGKNEYTYPSSNKMQVVEFKYKNNKWEQAEDPVNLEFDNKGNLMKAENGRLKVDLSYDDKNAPFLNVTGWSKIRLTGGIPFGENLVFEDVLARRNNPNKTTATDNGTPLLNITFTNEFNDNQHPKFPTKITGKENAGTKFTVVISYATQSGEPGDDEENRLPLELTMTSDTGADETTTITYQTNSKKIDQIKNSKNGSTQTYQYDGDRIVKIDFGSNGGGDNYKLFEYDATTKRPTSVTQYRSGKAESQLRYTYTSNTVLTLADYKYENDAWTAAGELINLELDANGNVIKVTSGDTEVSISYDAKKSPFFNVTGWAEIEFLAGIPLGNNMGAEDVIGRKNNPTRTLAKQDGTTLLDMAFTYEFNNDHHPNFPTKITGTDRPFTVTIVYN